MRKGLGRTNMSTFIIGFLKNDIRRLIDNSHTVSQICYFCNVVLLKLECLGMVELYLSPHIMCFIKYQY
jgi:hypothetical protein